jgi:hypothetical protein
MERSRRHSVVIVCAGLLGIVGIVGVAASAYWRYVCYVPPYTPELPPMPEPNGYERATKILGGMAGVDWTQRMPRWPDGESADLRARLDEVGPILDGVRATFALEWRARPELTAAKPFPSYVYLRGCAQCFVAESILASRGGDYGASMGRCLDAMELGSRIPRGGNLIAWLVGEACHNLGFSRVEQLISSVPLSALPDLVTRTRRIRQARPSLEELLETERVEARAGWTTMFQDMQSCGLTEQWESARSVQDDANLWGTMGLLLTPRRVALSDLETRYRTAIAESRKPVRRRLPVPESGTAWMEALEPTVLTLDPWRVERVKTELALLEVALAVRMHRLTRGRYPASLDEIERQWLPFVPADLWDQPIVYLLKAGQPLVYSLGPDGKDDGGQAVNPYRLAAATRGDLVFGRLAYRVWRDQKDTP